MDTKLGKDAKDDGQSCRCRSVRLKMKGGVSMWVHRGGYLSIQQRCFGSNIVEAKREAVDPFQRQSGAGCDAVSRRRVLFCEKEKEVGQGSLQC